MNARPRYFLILIVALALLGVGILTTESPSLILWQPVRAMVLESDDWGLPGFVPHAHIWDGRERQELKPGKFPDIYWGSTLEDSLMVARLCGILERFQGADGLPAVFQPNYVLSSLSLEREGSTEVWKRYDLPSFPPTYPRPGMWDAVQEGVGAGVWYPEFHAAWHYDPQQRVERALSTDLAADLTRAGVTLFPGSEAARELGPHRSAEDLAAELDQALAVFVRAFGRAPGSIIAPDYTWNGPMERIWMSRSLNVIQAKREQRDPTLPRGKVGRGLKYLYRKLALVLNRDRIYLERNCRLEPVQDADPGRIVRQCAADVQEAWRLGQPAIVETHRVNFSHTDPAVVQLGQDGLSELLEITMNSGEAPTFLTDTEVAQLSARGVSAVQRGGQLVLRNGSHSRRLVSLPARRGGSGPRLFALCAGGVLVIPSP